MKGTVLNFDVPSDQGLITGEDGQSYGFQSRDWQERNNFPKAGMAVDFEVNGEKATHIYFLPSALFRKPSKPTLPLNPETAPVNEIVTEPEIPNNGVMIKKMLLGLLGAIALFVGVFAPIMSIPMLGNFTYFHHWQGGGIFLLVVAFVSLLLVVLEKFNGLWLTGLSSLLLLTYTFIVFQTRFAELKASIEEQMQTNPLMGIAGLAVDSVQIQWGWALLGVGTLLLFTSAAIAERRTQKPISLKASFTRILKKFKPLEWLILFLICVFILIGVSKINLDHFRPKAIAERELEAKSMIATINRYQKAFLVENDHFANSLAELKLPNQPLHYYQNAELVTDGQDFTTIKMMPISMETQLHSFIGAVAYQRETRSFSVKICQSEEPFQVISAPELNADQLVCASGSNSINSF